MSSHHTLADLVKSAWRIAVQPAQFARRRAARYRAAGISLATDLEICRVDPMAEGDTCDGRCRYMERLTVQHLAEYRHVGQDWRWRPWLGTAAVIALDDHADGNAYLAAIGGRTGKAFLRSVAKARRHGYVTGFFPPENFATSLATILGSRLVRSGGLVPYALLPGRRPPADIGLPHGYKQRSWCPHHWTLHFGVFRQRPDTPLQLVGFVKLRRSGSLVHALQIMGHGDHLSAGVNDLMQADLVAWLLSDRAPLTDGVTHYMYGAIEHAGDGLAQWKLRRGFRPMLLAPAARPEAAAAVAQADPAKARALVSATCRA